MEKPGQNSFPFFKAAAIVAATWFVYAPVFHGGWLSDWDDSVEILGNTALRSPGGLWKIWFASKAPDYFPLKTTVQWVQWHLWRDHAAGYHITNVCLHLLSAFLLWHLLRKMGVRLAWFGGLIFAIHPLAVESVAWISELKNVLSLPFLLMAMCAYLNFDEIGPRHFLTAESAEDAEKSNSSSSPRPLRSLRLNVWGWYILSMALFVLAMLSKSSVVMFPVILLLYCWWKRGRITRAELLSSVPFFAVSLILGFVTVWFQSHRAIAGEVILTGGFFPRVVAAGLAVAFYFWKSVVPIGLMPIYPRWTVNPWALWQYWPWVVIGAVIFWMARLHPSERGVTLRQSSPQAPASRKRGEDWERHALFGLGFFLINLVPVLGFVPMSYLRLAWVADHFAYLPLVGLAGLAAAWIGDGKARLRFPLFAILIPLLLFESRHYASMFARSETLWTYNLRLNPGAWAAQNNLGNALLDAGRVQEAMDRYEEAARLHPDYAEAYNNIGNILSQNGREAEAAANYEKALRIKPDYAQAHNGLGNLLSQTGNMPEAIAQLDLALQYSPDYPPAENNLGNTLFRLGRYPEAEKHLKTALRLQPDYPEAHNNLGNVFLRTGRMADATAEYREALRLNPRFPEAYNNLGNIQMMSGRLSEAIASFDEALRLSPGYAEAHYNLGLAFSAMGRVHEAIAQFELALQFRPDFPQAREAEIREKKAANGEPGQK